jgi:CBS domain-containing protein
MNLASSIPDIDTPVVEHARKDFPLLDADMTVGQALERIRREGVGERVIYFYAIDEDKRLVGVVPTRRLLTAPLETALHEVMVRRVVAIPAKATVLDACEFFVLYKFLAFPVVDEQRHIVGIIDANLFAEEILEAGDTEDRSRSRGTMPVDPEFFEALGFRDGDGWNAVGNSIRLIRSNTGRQSDHCVFSHDGVGIKRKRQYAINERDDSCVALSQRDLGLARVFVSS